MTQGIAPWQVALIVRRVTGQANHESSINSQFNYFQDTFSPYMWIPDRWEKQIYKTYLSSQAIKVNLVTPWNGSRQARTSLKGAHVRQLNFCSLKLCCTDWLMRRGPTLNTGSGMMYETWYDLYFSFDWLNVNVLLPFINSIEKNWNRIWFRAWGLDWTGTYIGKLTLNQISKFKLRGLFQS